MASGSKTHALTSSLSLSCGSMCPRLQAVSTHVLVCTTASIFLFPTLPDYEFSDSPISRFLTHHLPIFLVFHRQINRIGRKPKLIHWLLKNKQTHHLSLEVGLEEERCLIIFMTQKPFSSRDSQTSNIQKNNKKMTAFSSAVEPCCLFMVKY